MEVEWVISFNFNDLEMLVDVGYYFVFLGEFEKGIGFVRWV